MLCIAQADCLSFDYAAASAQCRLHSSALSIAPEASNSGVENYTYYERASNAAATACVYGCTDPGAANWDSSAREDDGSCELQRVGCTDPSALNFEPTANTDSGNCDFCGESDNCVVAPEAEPAAVVLGDGGCTDFRALNFNASATDDDGSCQYSPLSSFSCPVVGALSGNNVDLGGGIQYYSDLPNAEACAERCLNNTLCESFDFSVSGARCYLGTGVVGMDGANTGASSYRYYQRTNYGSGCVYGCMDPAMFNFDAEAGVENGTCIPFRFGCLDPMAENYDAAANIDGMNCSNTANNNHTNGGGIAAECDIRALLDAVGHWMLAGDDARSTLVRVYCGCADSLRHSMASRVSRETAEDYCVAPPGHVAPAAVAEGRRRALAHMAAAVPRSKALMADLAKKWTEL